MTGYAPVPQRFDAAPSPVRTASPASSSLRGPAFKGSGMKLGSKKTRQSELLDALGSEALLSEDMSTPGTPAASHTPELPVVASAPKNDRGSLPPVNAERFVYSYNSRMISSHGIQCTRCDSRNNQRRDSSGRRSQQHGAQG